MKVLMLSWEYPPHNVGGLGKHVMELLPALARAGVEVHLLTPAFNGGPQFEVIRETAIDRAHLEPSPATVHRIDTPRVDIADFFSRAIQTNFAIEDAGRHLLENGGYDLIHAHDWLVGFAGVAIKHAFHTPLVATIHATEYGRNRGVPSADIPRAIHNVEWWLTYEAWRVICCSDFMSSEVRTVFGTPADKIDVVPNGVDTSRFDRWEGHDLSEFRRRYAHDSEKILFHVGRIVREKGVHLLVEAMPRLLAARSDLKLVVAGTGGELDQCRQRADELGVGANILFTGFVGDDDRDRLLRIADVAVFPSLYEPFGIVALEAMAARAPVVVSSVGGLTEVVDLHETGITVYPDDVDSLIWGILHTLDHPEWSRQRADNAYGMVRDRFNWDAIARDTIATYRRVIEERRRTPW
ncbi:MAG: glycosyltransferase family 1 protein [Chloroflexota bacterium]|nr:MAG: glycosyltransferase family 1 protein [Chloroflexota bacterium]